MDNIIIVVLGILGSIASIIGLILYYRKKGKSDQPENSVANTITGDKNIQAGRDVTINKSQDSKKKLIKHEVLRTFYQQLSELNMSMLDMTLPMRIVTGKDEETIQKEEIERVNNTARLGDEFLRFYQNNKIHFDKDACALIEQIQGLFKSSHIDYSARHHLGLPPSKLTLENSQRASKIIREKLPPLIEQLEDILREAIND